MAYSLHSTFKMKYVEKIKGNFLELSDLIGEDS